MNQIENEYFICNKNLNNNVGIIHTNLRIVMVVTYEKDCLKIWDSAGY